MKLVCLSDTHSFHRKIKEIQDGDVLIHAGDITFKGEVDVLGDFADWMKELPHKNKIVIFGNHEIGMRYGKRRQFVIDYLEECGIIYLENSGVEISGEYFYGSPATPFFHNWEWNYHRGKDIKAVWDQIPLETSVLITHGPPFGILDDAPRDNGKFDHVGCEELLDRIWKLPKLKLSVCGHIHSSYNKINIENVQFVNASICNEQYNPINPPQIIEI